jgi:hypothetical protein
MAPVAKTIAPTPTAASKRTANSFSFIRNLGTNWRRRWATGRPQFYARFLRGS